MKKTEIDLEEIKLVGITARTNNTEEFSGNGKIPQTMQKYFSQNLAEKINNRKNPGKLFCVYTNFESDHNGDYTYFIGEEVNDFKETVTELEQLIIPFQKYQKFTSQSGVMPAICINMWQEILRMSSEEIGGRRKYIADFEVYDERSIDPENTILDIYIGISKIDVEDGY